jgi:ATPase subunit of ABC transporter with duplicated ATPase domains
MNANAYRAFFGLQAEPFPTDLALEHILQTPDLLALNDRFQFAVSIGAIALVTGEVGAGKSTALRWATSQLHPAQYRVVWITASSGSILGRVRHRHRFLLPGDPHPHHPAPDYRAGARQEAKTCAGH